MKTALIFLMVGAVLFLTGKIGLGRKPSENTLVNARAKTPVQTTLPETAANAEISTKPIQLDYDGQHYTLYPRASYSIEGLIVSEHRSDSSFDLAHARTGDKLNSRDICTVWGRTLAGGVYRDIKFWSGDWTCYYQFNDPETAAVFDPTEVSNTHVLAKDPQVRDQLARLEVGDEYRMHGWLVDYELAGVGRRNTSLARNDTENGACEILLVKSVEILRSHNRLFGKIRDIGCWTALLALVTIFAMMIRSIFFGRKTFTLISLLIGSALAPAMAHAKLCNASTEYCGDGMGSSGSSSSSSASRGGKIRINPAFVPIAKGFGAEFLLFDGSVDVSLVKGLGRIGAAISPSNSEETFFGPPGVEAPDKLFERKEGRHKFESQKITLATAFGLYDNKSSGLRRFSLNLGVMGKLNRQTSTINLGGGVSGVAGPFTFGYSRYNDETEVDMTLFGGTTKDLFPYSVETYSIGAFLGPLAIDYSVMNMRDEERSNALTVPIGAFDNAANITVITATLLYERTLTTAAMRTENLTRASYNFETSQLELVDKKVEYFGGLQVLVADPLLLGVFYNYYLMRDISFGATLFF